MSVRLFRFGASLNNSSSRSAWSARAREVENLGYDILQVPDHLAMVAPFPSLVAAPLLLATVHGGRGVAVFIAALPALLIWIGFAAIGEQFGSKSATVQLRLHPSG